MDRKVYEFISSKTGDQIIEWRTCAVSGQEFPMFQSDKEFYDKISPVIAGKKYPMPFPKLCPEERERRRFTWRNERTLYQRKCDVTGKPVISVYSQDKPYKVYDQDLWRGDQRNPFDYGREYDCNKPFFQQFDALLKNIPLPALYNTDVVNCDYNNHLGNSKNCYLVFASRECEDCMHADRIMNSKRSMDGLAVNKVEHCYECVSCNNCYKVYRGTRSDECANSMFLLNCKNCNYCYACCNLVGQQFCIYNKQYTKEDYLKIIAEKQLGSYANVQAERQKFDHFCAEAINKSVNTTNIVNSFGNVIRDCKNCYFCFDVIGGEDCKYGINGEPLLKNNQDGIGIGAGSELAYEVIDSGVGSMKNCFAFVFRVCSNTYYTYSCNNSSNLFGCVGLRNQSYCVLNKQYTKEEYEQLVPKIIDHMNTTGERGEFFPIQISPFGYNETIAQNNYPLTKEEALSRGYKRQDTSYHINVPENKERILASQLPDDITDVKDDILEKVILCEVSGDPFRIIKQELEFYRTHNLPLPHRHPNIRCQERMLRNNERKLYSRTCDTCGQEMLSVYKAQETGKIYCEQCYNKEVYG